jgi:beta-galactosidase
VRVDHSRFADSRFYTGSGIYRHVRLVPDGPVARRPLGHVCHHAQNQNEAALVRIETTVKTPPKKGSTRCNRTSRADGAWSRAGPPPAARRGQSQTLVQEIENGPPQRWSLDTPVLYTLRSRVKSGHGRWTRRQLPFGIRTLTFDPDKGFLLNGRSTKLKGVCIHHDAGSLGAAVPDKVLERRLARAAEIGVNAIRTSHNPPAPELLDLCDRLGLLVKDEAFDEFTPSKTNGSSAGMPASPAVSATARCSPMVGHDMQDLVRRDRNHPSIILWSIGNEIDYPNDPFSHPVLGDKYPGEPARGKPPHLRRSRWSPP